MSASHPARTIIREISATARWRLTASSVLLLTLAIRLIGLNDLVLFGDAASSVFFAMQGWLGIASATAIDSHPPGYYYLLRLSLDLIGWNELGARLPSLFPGVLLVAVVLATGRRLAGETGGAAVGLLAALSPALVVYSRQPRMYALLAFLGIVLLTLAAGRRMRRREFGLLALALASLLTHYFAVVAVGAAALVCLVGQSGPLRGRLTALWPFALAGLLWSPWLVYALGESLRHTERTISGVPPQPTLLHFLGSLSVLVPVGTFLPLALSITLSLAWWLGAVGLLVAARSWPGWPAVALFAVTGSASAIYLVQPAFGRPRFFLILVPLALLALAQPLAMLRRSVSFAALAALAALQATGLAFTVPVERGTFELDAVRLGEALQSAGSADIVILQPWWQAGYLRTHLDPAPRLLALRDLSAGDWPDLVASPRQVWLVMTGVARRDPDYPLEAWLDAHAFRVDEQGIGTLRLVRYAVAPDPPLPPPVRLENGLMISAAPAVRDASAGGALPVLVRWESQAALNERLVLFLHLDNLDGAGRAGRDEEPDAGARQDGRWAAGEVILDRRGLVVPIWTPPGEYQLVAGIYRRSDGSRIAVDGSDTINLGRVAVRSAEAPNHLLVAFDSRLGLVGWTLLRPDPAAATRTRIDTVDGPQTLVEPISAYPGQTLSVLLTWKRLAPADGLTAFVHLLDDSGRIVAQADHPPSLAGIGEAVSDRFELVLPSALPPGRYRLVIGLYGADGSRLTAAGRDVLELGSVVVGG
ncbi:MAG: glycosyltransferase family 39 protein [Dehalococcoidia bacterium]